MDDPRVQAVITNPRFTCMRRIPPRADEAILSSDPDVLFELAGDIDLCPFVANNPEADAKTLDRMASHPCGFTLRMVINHDHVAKETVEKLARHPHEDIRREAEMWLEHLQLQEEEL